jgi:hypothetical protein
MRLIHPGDHDALGEWANDHREPNGDGKGGLQAALLRTKRNWVFLQKLLAVMQRAFFCVCSRGRFLFSFFAI